MINFRILIKNNPLKLPLRNRAEKNEEWMRETQGLEICPECDNVYYKKRWVHSLAKLGKLSKRFERSKIKSKICPACKMIKDHAFEGEVIIEGIPANQKQDLTNLIHAFGERAMEKDPQDRIIELEKKNGTYRLITTENQLAVKLGKKIRDVFKKVDLHISYSEEPSEVSRIYVKFK